MSHLNYSRFQKGSGVYVCRQCGRRTRDVGDGSGECELCSACYAKAFAENAPVFRKPKGETDAKA
jgi:hypothetical protein